MSQQPTQPTHLQPPQTTNTLIFLQSVSGLGISLFSTIHLLTHTTVLYNLNFANNLLLGTRVLYQTPLIEPLLLGTLAVHAGCGAVRSYQRRQRRAERNFEKRGEKAVAREVHRYVGVFLTGGTVIPPNAVKGISFHRKLLIGCGVCSTVMVAGILFHLHQATLVLSETFYKIHIPLAFFYKSLLKSN